ncbi:uncharacterized protein [Molothrus aeneus]|uniref:uncharacterized protein n=1 Tax=Molothrus aeneus TaxID=84833 RepID=UPI00345AD213
MAGRRRQSRSGGQRVPRRRGAGGRPGGRAGGREVWRGRGRRRAAAAKVQSPPGERRAGSAVPRPAPPLPSRGPSGCRLRCRPPAPAPLRDGPRGAQQHTGFSADRAITEWLGLEGTLKNVSFPPPCRGQGHLPLDQAAQCPIQRGLGLCQGRGIPHTRSVFKYHLLLNVPRGHPEKKWHHSIPCRKRCHEICDLTMTSQLVKERFYICRRQTSGTETILLAGWFTELNTPDLALNQH